MSRIGLDGTLLNLEPKTGVGRYVEQLIQALLNESRKQEFLIFGFTPTRKTSLHFNCQTKFLYCPIKLYRRLFLLWQSLDFPPLEWLTGELAIFHSFHFYLPPTSKAKLVATVFDLSFMHFPQFHQTETVQLDQMRWKRIEKNAILITTISEYVKKEIQIHFPGKWVEVIYPAPAPHFQPNYDSKILSRYHLEPGYVLSVATMEPRKNLEFLIEGYLKSGLREKLVLVGSQGWKNHTLRNLIEKIPDKIKLLGYIPDQDLPALYSQAKFLVYPSIYEGFGLPVVEAMSVGTPVLCSKTSSLPEAGGDAVLYIDPKDQKDLIKNLRLLSSNKNLLGRLKHKGLKHVKKFSWSKSARKLLQLYQQLLQGKGTGIKGRGHKG